MGHPPTSRAAMPGRAQACAKVLTRALPEIPQPDECRPNPNDREPYHGPAASTECKTKGMGINVKKIAHTSEAVRHRRLAKYRNQRTAARLPSNAACQGLPALTLLGHVEARPSVIGIALLVLAAMIMPCLRHKSGNSQLQVPAPC